MEKEIINNIFEFIKKNDNKNKPLRWKLINNEPLTKEELTIKGDLYLDDSEITSLPKGLKIWGDLSLWGCDKIKSLPEELEVGGWLNLENCTSLTSLPEGLKVRYNLDIKNTVLAELSDDELFKMIEPNGYIKRGIER
jgi:hypothetical protein